jgi:hypothetical protein
MAETYIEIDIPDGDYFLKIIKSAALDIINRFNLKMLKPHYMWSCFKKKNSNRYFKKHLGFTYHSTIKYDVIDGRKNYKFKKFFKIYDDRKFMLFILKHGFVIGGNQSSS